MVAAGEFRKDLLYRINTIAIEIPALRHRKEDIVLLADAFLTQWANKYGRNKLVLDEQAKNALVSYDWPGNIRELNHVLERAQILCQGVFINVNDLGLSVNTTQTDTAKVDVKQGEFTEKQTLDSLADLELTIIDQRLKHFDGNVLKAAKSLGLSRSALYRRLDKI
jgi:DNA-binding NtrC family response regulator